MFLQVLSLLLHLHYNLITLLELFFQLLYFHLDHITIPLISSFDPDFVLLTLQSLSHDFPVPLIQLYLHPLRLI